MFTGLIQEIGEVLENQQGKLIIKANFPLEPGESINVNGVCLTVVEVLPVKKIFNVEVTSATIQKTNLGKLREKEKINLERALAVGEHFGGHWVTGHSVGTGSIQQITKQGSARIIEFFAPEDIMKSIVSEGSVAIDGVSLTVWKKAAKSFFVSVIPYTQKTTTLAEKKVGDLVNIEPDILFKYLEQVFAEKKQPLDWEYLKKNGFL